MALSPQWLDELRARVTLSSVVMRTTKLHPRRPRVESVLPVP